MGVTSGCGELSEASSAGYQGVISGTGGITLLGGGTVTLSAANAYGSLTGTSGPAANGGTIVRNGTLIMSNVSSLGVGGTLELGDVTVVLANAHYATAGSSLLGVERDTITAVDNVGSLGGAFNATAGGLIIAGLPNAGPGAFYSVSRVIDGVTFGSADIGKTILVKDETDNPERNGIYSIININDDLTMNLVRVTDFSTVSNMRYGTQVTVSNGTQAGQTFFMAASDRSRLNSASSGVSFTRVSVVFSLRSWTMSSRTVWRRIPFSIRMDAATDRSSRRMPSRRCSVPM